MFKDDSMETFYYRFIIFFLMHVYEINVCIFKLANQKEVGI